MPSRPAPRQYSSSPTPQNSVDAFPGPPRKKLPSCRGELSDSRPQRTNRTGGLRYVEVQGARGILLAYAHAGELRASRHVFSIIHFGDRLPS